MVPGLIIQRARDVGLDLLAVTDHNSGENAAAVVAAAERTDIAVLPGMEVESREGVHVLTLFDDVGSLGRWQEVVYGRLPRRENVERLFGAQLVVDRAGQLLRVNRRLLMAAVDLSLEDVVALSGALGGLAIPAHVDRPANGLLSVLGFPPPALAAPALEVSSRLTTDEAVGLFPQLAGRTLIRSSDAHALEDIGRATTTFVVAAPSVGEIALACKGEQGRAVVDS